MTFGSVITAIMCMRVAQRGQTSVPSSRPLAPRRVSGSRRRAGTSPGVSARWLRPCRPGGSRASEMGAQARGRGRSKG